jgi:transposase
VRRTLPTLIEVQGNGLTPARRRPLAGCYEELCAIASRIEAIADEVKSVSHAHEDCQRLSGVEGYGLLTSTGLSAAVGDTRTFRNDRPVVAWIGLVQRQGSSGIPTALLGIGQRGDLYLHILRIEGAMSAVRAAATKMMRAAVPTGRRRPTMAETDLNGSRGMAEVIG